MSACTFFGHRDCYGVDRDILQGEIEKLICKGVDTFYVGNQGQFDGMVYSCLKRLRTCYPHIRVCVVLAYFPTEDTAGEDMMYPEIEGHPKFAIDRRNKWMIRHADVCLCWIDHTWGGAYKYACLAARKGLEMIRLGNRE